MANLRNIKDRINSIKNTQKITKYKLTYRNFCAKIFLDIMGGGPFVC